MITRKKSCLILIDLQEGFRDPKWGVRNNVLLERNVSALLAHFRAAGLPVIHVRHDSHELGSPLRSGTSGFEFLAEATPRLGEVVITKNKHGAFVGTGLERHLIDHGYTELVLAGLTTDHCVSTTARMACDLGFLPILVGDATATFPRSLPGGRMIPADEVHECALASLEGEFARVLTMREFGVYPPGI